MTITNIISQHRRDFYANMKCEGCGHEKFNVYGYDDTNFHVNVIPKLKCDKCGKSTIDLGLPINPRQTKYPDGMQV
jgi:ribosomal protein S27E